MCGNCAKSLAQKLLEVYKEKPYPLWLLWGLKVVPGMLPSIEIKINLFLFKVAVVEPYFVMTSVFKH